MKLQKGSRIYNRGDMANPDHFGTVTQVSQALGYQITPDEGSCEREPYWIRECMISPEDKGHGGTRIVTEEAHQAYRKARIEEMEKAAARAK